VCDGQGVVSPLHTVTKVDSDRHQLLKSTPFSTSDIKGVGIVRAAMTGWDGGEGALMICI
jgi:hypothetical protein